MTRTLHLLTLFFGSAMAAIAAGEKADGNAAVIDAGQERAKSGPRSSGRKPTSKQ